jgi:hypothetical protein
MRIFRAPLLIACLIVSGSAGAQTTTPAPAPASPVPCEAAEYHQFDFWVGHWDVYPTGKEKLVAHSLIESLYGGCAIRENWMPLVQPGGGSLSSYVPHERIWRQTWVDSSSARVDFTGGMKDGAMVLTGLWRDVNGPGKDGIVRMTYSKSEGGSVRQLGEVSTDDGKTWGPSFDFTYKPSAAR